MFLPEIGSPSAVAQVALRVSDPELSSTHQLFARAVSKPGPRSTGRMSVEPAPGHRSRVKGSFTAVKEVEPNTSRRAPARQTGSSQIVAERTAELEARRRLVRLQKDLRRSSSEAAVQGATLRRLALASSVRNDLERLSGSQLTESFHVEPATEEEVGTLAMQIHEA